MAETSGRRGQRIEPAEQCTATFRGGSACPHPGWWACNVCGAVRCGLHSALVAAGRECRNGPRQEHSNHRTRL